MHVVKAQYSKASISERDQHDRSGVAHGVDCVIHMGRDGWCTRVRTVPHWTQHDLYGHIQLYFHLWRLTCAILTVNSHARIKISLNVVIYCILRSQPKKMEVIMDSVTSDKQEPVR